MAPYYTVSFTAQTLIKKYGTNGKIISETKLDRPITITALPYSTAMSYSGCDNFKIGPYVMEERRSSNGSGRDASVGNGTKKVDHSRYEKSASSGRGAVAVSSAKNTGRSTINNAAATGNLAAAINI